MSYSSRVRATNRALDEIVRECALRIEEAIREQVAARLDEAVNRALKAQEKTLRSQISREVGKSTRPKRMCPVPGCGLPAAGPKYSWRCRSHKEVSKEEILRLRAAEAQGAVVVVENGVRITKLPPAPAPGTRKRAGPPMECRAQGCHLKSRGPRYEFFCGEHYRTLNAEERRAASEAFRQRRLQEKREAIAQEPVVRRRRSEDDISGASASPAAGGALEGAEILDVSGFRRDRTGES